MNIAVCKETAAGETRVAATPETVRQFVRAGWQVTVQAGAGASALVTDAEYEKVGAKLRPTAEELLADADVVLTVQPKSEDTPRQTPTASGGMAADVRRHVPQDMSANSGRHGTPLPLRTGQVLVGLLFPVSQPGWMAELAAGGVTGFAMDAVPRIARAQSMDALSSQATVAGYKAVLLAADRLPRFLPLMMTAAGTIQPASALVLGAGVAGLQAIATAHRLGAAVRAVDTRPVVQEQVESLGAKFLALETTPEQAQDAGGYARDLGEAFYRKEQDQLAPHVKGCDLIIATAMIPNRRAPVLVTEAMVATMAPGGVIIDVAAPVGGNCAATKPGQWVQSGGVAIYGPTNLPAEMPVLASQLYARNLATFLRELIKDGQVKLDLGNEVIRSMLITHDGQVVHEPTKQALARPKA